MKQNFYLDEGFESHHGRSRKIALTAPAALLHRSRIIDCQAHLMCV